ncbi:NAD(P)/FAD-dependent oxidoreductase [Cohnella hongkongensis]|uniref:Ferredoxin--NADP reductase n=1 Tax=Cohnella hongkongensis TaxID=178337 RepID=A0ABV9FE75_9BACL
MQEKELYDVTIVGGGPAGMYAAFYGGMRDMKVKLIEGSGQLGGFLHTYSEKMIWDVGGIPPIRCEKLIEWLAQQAVTFEPTLVFHQRVEGFERQPDGTFALRTNTGELHDTRTVIIAVGRGIAELQKLDVEGAERYELTNLHYTANPIRQFSGKHVLLSGGGNSAVDWAIELADIANRVTVVHRKEDFRAMERNVALMRKTAEVRTPYSIATLHGRDDRIQRVTIAHADSGERETLDVDAVIVSHGFSSNLGALAAWGLETSEGLLAVSEATRTNVPGIFAAGDCAAHPGKVRLIAGAFNDAILAINSAKHFLEPEAPGMAYVSSHNEIFRERNKLITGNN